MLAQQIYRGMVRPVKVFPEPVLKERSLEVPEAAARTTEIVDDLVETMLSLPRCVGLAAPQLGILSRIVVIDASRAAKASTVAKGGSDRGPNHGLVCLINPVIVMRAGKVINREGCVSVPDFTANVRRSERVAIDYVDCDGKRRGLEACGFEAIVLQHEIDHLDGVLFLDRVSPEDVFKRRPSPAVAVGG